MKIGLALGGGSARGLLHLHVLSAMEDLGLKPTAISGTSIGGLIGAGYASGMSADDLEQFFLQAFSKKTEVFSRFWSMKPTTWSELWHRGVRLSQFNLEIILEGFLPATFPHNFEELKLPFSVVAADLNSAKTVVITQGDLRSAIAASASIPGLFRPIIRHGHLLADGGLCNPVPFDCLPVPVDAVIGVDVVGLSVLDCENKIPSTINSLLASNLVVQRALIESRFLTSKPDLLLRPPVDGIYLLDFLKTKEILKRTKMYKDVAKREISEMIERKKIAL